MSKQLQFQKCRILLRSKSFEESSSFYQAVGLCELAEGLFSDGSMEIELRDQIQNFPAIYIEPENDSDVYNHYTDLGIIFDCISTINGTTELFFTDPNGLNIFLGEKTQPTAECLSTAKIAELSHGSRHFADSANFWVQLGAKCEATRSNYPRTLVQNGPLRLGIHDHKKKPGQGIIFNVEPKAITELKKLGFPLMKNTDGSYLTFSPEGVQCTIVAKYK